MTHFEPACSCACCGGQQLSRQIDPENRQEFFVCPRCRFAAGSTMTDLQAMIGRLWRQADQGGNVRPEDIYALQRQSHYDPYGTYEIQPPDPMEDQAACEQSQRLRPAIEEALPSESVEPPPTPPYGLPPGPEPALVPVEPQENPLPDARQGPAGEPPVGEPLDADPMVPAPHPPNEPFEPFDPGPPPPAFGPLEFPGPCPPHWPWP